MEVFQLQCSYLKIFVLGLWLSIISGLSVLGAETPLKVQTLVEEAFQRNPEIQTARHRWEATKASIPQVQSLPDPVLGFGYRGPDIMREGRFQIQQQFPFPGKLGLKGKVASKAADQVSKVYRATQLRVIAQLKVAYFNLHFIHESIEVVKKNLMILKELEKTAEVRYKVGKGIQQDVFRAQVELSREMERLTSLKQEQQTVTAELNRILNRPPTAPMGKPEEPTLTPLPYSLEELTSLVKQQSPLLQVQAHGIEKSQSSLALAQREYYPDFVVTLGTMQSFRSDELTDAFGMFGIKIPLYYSTKQRYGEKEALANLEGARKNYDAVLQNAVFRMKDNVVRVQRAARLVKLIGGAIIPQASLALESSMAGYGVGKVDFLTMLDNVLKLQQDELDLHRQTTDHEIAIARIEEVIGQPLHGNAVAKD
ncbi:MAG: PTS cellobiose transporter subunit IIC [Nitrospirales bacterium]|nr:MAG: PTS cellobiose transporter subunit IIC [Nitrospirales bacterium]